MSHRPEGGCCSCCYEMEDELAMTRERLREAEEELDALVEDRVNVRLQLYAAEARVVELEAEA